MRRPAAVAIVVALLNAHAHLLAHGVADEFGQAKWMGERDGKIKATSVTLCLEDERLVIRSATAELKTLPYETIRSAAYTYTKKPRWKEGIGMGFLIGPFALPIFFLSGKSHWLTIHGQDGIVVVKLDKSNYKLFLPAFESRSGVKVETIAAID
jgi:hypothetical protein